MSKEIYIGSQLTQLKKEMKSLSSSIQAKNLSRFFKTGKGEYGEGDRFIGLSMPQIRLLAGKFRDMSISDLGVLVRSPIHEERMVALVIMILRYPQDKDQFYALYMRSRRYINNWDLVDVTCPCIVGEYLLDKPRDILYTLAKSRNIWERRMAIISTAQFIRNEDFSDTLQIAEILLVDSHDLIHKAVGWMLREVGKKNKEIEKNFLRQHFCTMPRTMLRYAIEKFPEEERRKYLKKKSRVL